MSENYELTAWADEDLLGIAHHTLDHWGKPQAERYDLQLRERFTIIGEGAVPFQLPLKRYRSFVYTDMVNIESSISMIPTQNL